MGHTQIDDGQHHEYKGLQGDDQDVKNCPGQPENDLYYKRRDGAQRSKITEQLPHRVGSRGEREKCDQDEDQLTSVKITEQPQRQGDGFCEFLDELQEEVKRYHPLPKRVQEQLLREASDTLNLDAVEDHQKKHGDRHPERDVEVGGRNDLHVLDAHGDTQRR